jgi:ATP-binding cassette subfamily B protein
LTSCGLVIVLGVGGYFSYKNQVSVSEVIGFVFYLGLFYAPISGLAQLMEAAQHAIAGAERVIEILDTPVEIHNASGAVTLPRCEGGIRFEGVSFRYDENKPILKNVDLDIRPGTFTALVGPTGVGKTTAVNLMARFYDPTEGVIKLDGHDIKTLTLESLRRHIAFVPQDTFLFNTTLSDNIAYARPEATRDEIIAAAKIARIHDDIEEMPDGYDSVTGERGVKLSGGQKQRIAIARAVLAGAPVLILDEATSSVDTRTEVLIQIAMARLLSGRTSFVIAHRLSTIRDADMILVMKEGDIIEQGNHEVLLSQGGFYADLYMSQFSGGEDAE